jgi:hypothetical protein
VADYGKDVAMALVPFLGPLEKAKKAGNVPKVIKAAAKKAVGKATENIEHPPVPGEGEVGIYGRMQQRSDTANHHLPTRAQMERHGVRRNEGVAIRVQQQRGAREGRHVELHRRRAETNESPRDDLAQGIRRFRNIYQQDKAYTPDIRKGLQDAIELNKRNFPRLFLKGE